MTPTTFSPALPTAGGVYVLLLQVARPAPTNIGSLGLCHLPVGWLLYVGSALAGLKTRVGRHARANKHLHWHIDYVLQVATLRKAWCRVGPERLECDWARLLAAQPGITPFDQPLGASDCACYTHLYCADEESAVQAAYRALNERWPCQRHTLNIAEESHA